MFPSYYEHKSLFLIGLINVTVNNTIIVGNYNTPLTPMDRSQKQKIIKEHTSIKWYIRWDGSIDIFRTFHPNTEEYNFSSSHGAFFKIDHILGHKLNLSKFKEIEIVSSIFSNHSAKRLDIN